MGKKIINVVGPSASGKTSLVHEILKEFENKGVAEIVSDTSREIRNYANEVHGRDYYFRTKEEMINMATKGEFVEFNDSYVGDDLYGIRREEIENKFNNNDILFVITDMNGNKQLKDAFGQDLITVFIMADEEMLKSRLRKRGDSEENINKRINKLHESKELENYKYADFVVLNKYFKFAYNQLINIVELLKAQ